MTDSNDWPPQYQAYGVTLRQVRTTDLEKIRQWRNDPAISNMMLDKTHITPVMQLKWFADLSGDKSRAYWIAEFKQQDIGVASLSKIDMNNQSAEPGMYIYPEKYRNNIVPFCVAFALNDFAFEVLRVETLYGKIYRDNEASVRFHEKCGYLCYQQTTKLDLYRLTHEQYLKARDPITHFIRY
jgi:UDP-4-amino-4,6-dideoxy-N-acetyl-beta-L-altrosamine N-acetyltransferase